MNHLITIIITVVDTPNTPVDQAIASYDVSISGGSGNIPAQTQNVAAGATPSCQFTVPDGTGYAVSIQNNNAAGPSGVPVTGTVDAPSSGVDSYAASAFTYTSTPAP